MQPSNKPFGVEIHQLDWIPNFLKERQLEQIFPILKAIKFDQKLLVLFNHLKEKTTAREFLDLGSGAGNVIEYLVKNSPGDYTYFVSDLQPRWQSYQKIKQRNSGRINFVPYKVDMCEADGILKDKAVTIITTFHELDRRQAQKVITNLMKNSKAFLIAEPVNKSAGQLLELPLILLYFWLAPFFTKPKSFSRLFFSWVWPILPLFHIHDGLVSLLRSYRKADFLRMLQNGHSSGWQWEIDHLGPDTTYVLAWRKSES